MTEIVIDPLTAKIVMAVVAGTIISGLAALGAAKQWGWKKFLYTLGLAGIGGLVIVDASDGINADNAISILLEIVGASFIGNKLLNIGGRLKK
jgi:hypothetical protein